MFTSVRGVFLRQPAARIERVVRNMHSGMSCYTKNFDACREEHAFSDVMLYKKLWRVLRGDVSPERVNKKTALRLLEEL